MTVFYVDFEGGNDASSGTSFAQRWKTLTSGATAARIAPGDEIRIMASPEPTSLGQSATWTDNSPTVTLTTAVTQTITNCETAWTASANVTCSISSSFRHQGSAGCGFAFSSGFTTGKAAHFPLTTLDLSAYEQISFWLYLTGTLTTGSLQIKLCSDSTGDTPVDTFTISDTLSNSHWHCFTINKGSALGSSISSIALYAISDPGTPTVYLDHIIACKAASANDALTLRSLIGKNNGSELEWWPIATIEGTTITLNGGPWASSISTATVAYFGTTASVTTYKREAIYIGNLAAQTVGDSGTAGSPITYSGGWDRTNMSTRNGITWLGGKGPGSGLTASSKSYVSVDKLYFSHWVTGVDLSGAAGYYNWLFGDLAFSGCTNGLQFDDARRLRVGIGRAHV